MIRPRAAHTKSARKNSDRWCSTDGHTLFDSRVILEYLDHLAGGGRIIRAKPALASARCACRRCATASGCSLLQVYEARYRPEDGHERPWTRHARPARSSAGSTRWKGPAGNRRHAACRADRARLCARLSGSALPGRMAEILSEARGLARPISRQQCRLHSARPRSTPDFSAAKTIPDRHPGFLRSPTVREDQNR